MKKLAIIVLSIGVLAQCKKEKPQPPTDPVGPTNSQTNGTIVGKIYQHDQFGMGKTNGLNTTTISINGTSFSTVTDALGNYTISNVPAGTYTLTTVSPNSRPISVHKLEFVGNGVKGFNMFTCDTARYSFSSCLVKDTVVPNINTHFAYIEIGLTPVTGIAGALVLFGSNQNININDPNSYFDLVMFQIPYNSGNCHKFLENALPSGTTFVKIYPLPYNSVPVGQYYFIDNNKRKFVSNGNPIPGVYTLVR